MTRFAICVALTVLITNSGRTQTVDEYQIKSAFLYNLARFVEWPESENGPLRICILGKNPFDGVLTATLSGKTISGRPLVISAVDDPAMASGCQMLFVSTSERKKLRSVLSAFRPEGVLTVGDTEGFAEAGVMVNLSLKDGRVHMEINPEAAARAKLRISSKVLSLAQIVKGK